MKSRKEQKGTARTKLLKIFVVAVVAVLAIIITVWAVYWFWVLPSSNYDFSVRMGFGEIIGRRLMTDDDDQGIISVPIDPMELGGGSRGKSFTESINQLPRGDYRYFVYEDALHRRFIVFNDEPVLISSGVVLDDLLTVE